MFIHFRLDLTDHHLKLTTTFTDSDYITDMINSMLRSEKRMHLYLNVRYLYRKKVLQCAGCSYVDDSIINLIRKNVPIATYK